MHDGIGKLVAEWEWRRDARSAPTCSPFATARRLVPNAWLKASIMPFRSTYFPFLLLSFLFHFTVWTARLGMLVSVIVTWQDDARVEYVRKNKPGPALQVLPFQSHITSPSIPSH